jgi:hypothetical protein
LLYKGGNIRSILCLPVLTNDISPSALFSKYCFVL